MDAGLHHLQGQTKRVTPAELVDLLQELHRETVALVRRRQATARAVRPYDINNAYQQVIGRQGTHLEWIAAALTDLGGSASREAEQPEPPLSLASSDSLAAVLEVEVGDQRTFIERWQPRVANVTQARHRKMLELFLGEMREHQRVFQQGLDGRGDLLGRHGDRWSPRGEVLPGRPHG